MTAKLELTDLAPTNEIKSVQLIRSKRRGAQQLPAILTGPVVTDALGIPRYAATIWIDFLHGDLAPETLWCAPEILRIQALALSGDAREALLLEALVLAKAEGALSWTLRIATSLAETWRDAGDPARAHALISETLQAFGEGFGTADLQRAEVLLSTVREAA